MQRRMGRLAGCLLLGCCTVAGAAEPDLEKLQPDCSQLGPGWRPIQGIRLNDLRDLSRLPGVLRADAGKLVAQIQPLGIAAMGDYSCAQTSGAQNVATVRAFRFADTARAEAWWRQKYEYAGWQKHYARVESADHPALDSLQINKRVVRRGPYWITAQQRGEGQAHLQLLADVLARLGATP